MGVGPKANRRYTPPRRAVVITADIPDDAAARTREGLARRRLVATTGECPCGARLNVPELVPGTFTLVAVEHEVGCPAIDPEVVP